MKLWQKYLGILAILGSLGTGTSYFMGCFDTARAELDRQDTIDEMIKQYKVSVDSNHKQTFLDGLMRLHLVEVTVEERGEVVKEYRFTMSQIQTILFGNLNFVEETDRSGNHYHFWENDAGDYWLVINGIPYIVEYLRSGDYWYYITYDHKYIKVPPAEHNHAPEFSQEIEEDVNIVEDGHPYN